MGAGLVVDLGATVDVRQSIAVGSGANFVVGEIVDLRNADTFCNIYVAGQFGSGQIEVRVQTSPSTASGSFQDPTSGLVGTGGLPTSFVSGGVFFANSGLFASGNSSPCAPVNNAPIFCSGGMMFAAFQRDYGYARLILNSGVFPNAITAGFISQKRTVGSGAGFSFAPSSGTVNV